jgi:hypothetical protein
MLEAAVKPSPTDEQLSIISLNERERLIDLLNSRGAWEGNCFTWQLSRFPNGYGQFKYKSQNYGVHRFVWMLHHGPIEFGHVVMHSCDNPPCFLLDHLSCGAAQDNTQDMINKGRMPSALLRANRSKLSENDIREIRRLLAEGKLNQYEIGARFGVTNTNISAIKRGETWTHVQ